MEKNRRREAHIREPLASDIINVALMKIVRWIDKNNQKDFKAIYQYFEDFFKGKISSPKIKELIRYALRLLGYYNNDIAKISGYLFPPENKKTKIS